MTEQRVAVILFKKSGKYYTEEQWRIPAGAIGPYDMALSPDFRRIDDGPVLVETQEPWGFPHLFPANTEPDVERLTFELAAEKGRSRAERADVERLQEWVDQYRSDVDRLTERVSILEKAWRTWQGIAVRWRRKAITSGRGDSQ